MPDYDSLATTKHPNAKLLIDAIRAALDPKSKVKKPLRKSIAELLLTDDDQVLPIAVDVSATLAASAADSSNPAAAIDALQALAVGFDPYNALAHGIDDAILNRELASGLTLRDVRKPIVERASAFLPLLADKDSKVRIAASQLLAVLPEARPASALKAALAKEADPLTRYNLLFALAAHGEREDVPAAPAKNPALSIAARLVKVLHTGEVDGSLLDDTRKLSVPSEGFPGGDDPNQAVPAALVSAMRRRKNPDGLLKIAESAVTGGNAEMIAVYALAALWPDARTPVEPRSALSDDERKWLGPLLGRLSEKRELPSSDVLVRYGLVPTPRGGHTRRLLGLEQGAADAKLGGVPAWLLARRVVDGREPLKKWTDALAGRSGEEVIALVRDLVTFAVTDPWPTLRLPDTPTPVFEAYGRYFKLARASFALVPVESLQKMIDEERANPHQATALASLVDRGVEIPKTRDARITKLLRPLDEYDVDGLRTVLAALPESRRSAALENMSPEYELDPIHESPRLTGLWYFADLASPQLVETLVEHLASTVALDDTLTKAKSPKDQAIGKAFRSAIEQTFSKLGTAIAPPLRDALGSLKAKSPARPILELALSAAQGSPATAATKDAPESGKAKTKAKKKA